ncbi:hypothetical protein [uncultured Algoriphagus sp.]|uniref:hypothetical protein n=1 Tax=uncultured Algoriphagus sp. TaxID=417365 RepID=UPI0030EB66F3|tara:strand:+ start:598 stop:1185 length:588 start_codon:yes stop_codon:yes gene_type:complete
MKASKLTNFPLVIVVFIFLSQGSTFAQNTVPDEVASIVNMPLMDGETKLESLGYEICFSSLFGKKQDWYNKADNICITLHFDKKSHDITSVEINPETSVCKQEVEAANKIWEKYHDGQAPASSAKLDEERKKLADKGFKVSYWVDQLSPGRASEYWVNESTQQAMYIVWDVQGSKWSKTDKTDFHEGTNPAHAHK